MLAANCGSVKMVDMLREAAEREFSRKLVDLVRRNSREEIYNLLDEGVIFRAIAEDDKRVLQHMVKSGRLDMVERLIHMGAIGERRRTMLVCAVSEDNMEMSKLLIELGADVNERDQRSFTPLMYAAFSGNAEMTRMLVKFGAMAEPADEIQALCGEVDADTVDGDGKTALMRAVESGKEGLVEMLLKKGAVVKKADENGEMVEMLTVKNAAVNKCDRNGLSALDHAIRKRDMCIIKLLIEARASVDDCGICMDIVSPDGGLSLAFGSEKCWHLFHANCLQLRRNRTKCPICSRS